MQTPLTEPDTLFEELVQDLPPETAHLARAFKALVRGKTVKTPAPRLRVVFGSCGLDHSWREVAGTLTALDESRTDPSVAERWRACGPGVHTLRQRMRPRSSVRTRPAGGRVVVIEASSMQAPGAPGSDDRLQSAMDLWSGPVVEVFVSDVHTGDTRKHCTWAPGDGAVADRGEAQGQGLRAAVKQGADRIVRLHPCRVGLGDAAGAPVERGAPLQRPPMDTRRTLAVELHSTGGPQEVRGWGHASRLHTEPANRARQQCRQGPNTGTPPAASRVGAGWVLGFTTLAPPGLSPQTRMALYRGRGPVESALKRWQRGLDVDAWRAKAHSPRAGVWLHGKWRDALMRERRMRRQLGDTWGRLDRERLGTWGRVWGLRKDAMAPMMTGALGWQDEAWAACLKVLAARPRRRKGPQLPAAAMGVRYRCDASTQEGEPIAA